ncbi:acetate/propionate family kinase [Sulfurovum riftiae]|uniref:Acetate kinase n=1 Tax=Sulfurovum riftiae TaxID=1630136 RepID=A0A151CFU1_9BACT|nr:acetate kinase [Sulfurovum riftiae]KYJ86367.1 acetate kinase [Sulfurovum riftiae]
MKILVLNAGSSSLKCQLFFDETSVASVTIERIGEAESYMTLKTVREHSEQTITIKDHHHAIRTLFDLLQNSRTISDIEELDGIGHRVVHGGAYFTRPTKITPEIIRRIRSLIPLAPLHNPANLEGIEIIAEHYPTLTQIAVFDTAFHQTMPEIAARYPLPYRLYEEASVRRYGFHGTSHAYVAKEAAKLLKKPLGSLNLITLHLGNGASATAISKGRSIDTSMGMTPLEGLMMGTRSGDIDPAIIPYLIHTLDISIDEVDTLLNKESGLKGICGTNEMREIITSAESGDEKSRLALEMYVYRIRKYIGAYSAVLGSVDAIVFTGGIGEHAMLIREMVCEGLENTFGICLDKEKNLSVENNERAVHSTESKVALLVIPTNEELEIARQTETAVKASF